MNLMKIKDIHKHQLYVDADSLNFFLRKHYNLESEAVLTKLQELSNEINIPQIIAIDRFEDNLITTEEYIFGQTLESLIEQCQMISRDQFEDYCLQLITIVSRLHEQNLLHKDIKPQNIIIAGHTLYLIDFDITRLFDPNKSKDTKLIGTEGYASPEQYGFSQTTPASDIYSLGITFKQLIGITVLQVEEYRHYDNLIEQMILMDPAQRIELASLETEFRYNVDIPISTKIKQLLRFFCSSDNRYLHGYIETTHGLFANALATVSYFYFSIGINYGSSTIDFNHKPYVLLFISYYLTSIIFNFYLVLFSYKKLHNFTHTKNKYKVLKWFGITFLDILVFEAITLFFFNNLYKLFN